MNTKLVINHTIFLTKQQRYDLYNGLPIEVLGITTPIWCIDNKTTEPASEIFLKYFIQQDETISIKLTEDSYYINLPKNPKIQPRNYTNAEWILLSTKQQNQWLNGTDEISMRMLLDYKDNGNKFLTFVQKNNIGDPKDNKTLLHCIVIKDIQSLIESLV